MGHRVCVPIFYFALLVELNVTHAIQIFKDRIDLKTKTFHLEINVGTIIVINIF